MPNTKPMLSQRILFAKRLYHASRFLCPVGPVFPTNLGQGEKFINPVDPGAVEKVSFRGFQTGYVPIDKVPDILGFPEILAVDRKEGNLGAPGLGHGPVSDLAHDPAGCAYEVGKMEARAVGKKDEIACAIELREVSGDNEMEIRSAFELVEE